MYKNLSDTCFQPGDFILTTFLSKEKTTVEVDYTALKQIGKFLVVHKNLQVEIIFAKTPALDPKTWADIEKYLNDEIKPDVDRFTLSFSGPVNSAGKTKDKQGKFTSPIPTEIKILKPLPFQYKKAYKEKNEKGFFAGDIVKMPTVLYDFNKPEILPQSKDSLKIWANFIKDHSEFIFEIANHTDTRGADIYNLKLSEMRAESCYKYLTYELQIPKANLFYHGYGESQLIISDAEILKRKTIEEKEGFHQTNRRTELRIIGKVGDCNFYYNP